jgi:hypothetical protein
MSSLKNLIGRARKAAQEHLPSDVVEAGRRLGEELARRAPAPLADVARRLIPPEEASEATPTEANPAASPGLVPESQRERAEDVLQRVKQKSAHGLKPEDRLLVIYYTEEVAEDAAAIRALAGTVETVVREIDLARERPQVATQLAKLTGVMVPPYVYINGRYWGGRYDIESLAAGADLDHIVANRLDEISQEARRIGDIREPHSDEITVDNLLARWKLGHILCVDDLDAWYEVDKDGTERFFYQGAPHPADKMPAVAREVAAAVEAEEYEATWQIEPSVHLP